MANINAPYGLHPIQSNMGGASNHEHVQAVISSADTTKIFRGDPVKRLATGFIAQWTAGTAAAQWAGVFWGCEYLSVSEGRRVTRPYWPGADAASGTVVAQLLPVLGVATPVFRIQTNGVGVAFADIGANFDFSMATAGNTFTGQSGAVLDVASLATTSTLPLTLVGLYGGLPGVTGGFMGVQPGTDGPYTGSATGAFNWAIVRANGAGVGTGI